MNAPYCPMRVTYFAMIDTAMIRVVRAAGERAAMDRVVKAAIGLKDAFVTVAKQINDGDVEVYEIEAVDKHR